MTTNPTYKPTEGKREEFRRYLEKTGVMDVLTKCLVSLYEEPEKPTDALHYFLNKLSLQVEGESVEDVKNHLQEALTKLSALEEELNQLKAGEAQTEGPPTSPEGEQPPPPEIAEAPAAEPPAPDEPQQA